MIADKKHIVLGTVKCKNKTVAQFDNNQFSLVNDNAACIL